MRRCAHGIDMNQACQQCVAIAFGNERSDAPPQVIAEEQPEALRLAAAAAGKPDLTAAEAGIAYARVVLYDAATTGEIKGDPGSFFEGLAKFQQAAPKDVQGLKEFFASLAEED